MIHSRHYGIVATKLVDVSTVTATNPFDADGGSHINAGWRLLGAIGPGVENLIIASSIANWSKTSRVVRQITTPDDLGA